MNSAISLLIGWMLDLLLGDPVRLPHPIVWFGKAIAFFEHRLNKGAHRKLKGALTALFLTGTVFLVTWGIRHLLSPYPSYLIILFDALIIFYCLAGTTLIREVQGVFRALDRSLDEGRQQVARIVGRDTSELSAQEVRTAALETLAENLSDGVIAPLFWLALLGTPGMLAYKMVNTLDSMIGYRTERYRDFGCWAAHIDDIANFIPARVTALLMLFVGWITSQQGNKPTRQKVNKRTGLLRFLFHYGPQHASPNSGWPEAALAALLDCRFGGTHEYFGEEVHKPYIGTNPRQLSTRDMCISIRICLATEILTVCLVVTALLVLHLPFF